MKAVRLGIVLLALLASAVPAAVSAQSGGTGDADAASRARALFAEGVELAGQAQYAEAAVRFRQALALRDAPTIRYNLASTLFEEHQYTEAHEIAAALLAQPDLPEAVRTPTAALELQIGAASALVTFDLPDGVTGDLQVDDVPVADPSVATALAPGRHTARVLSGGVRVGEATFEVGSGVRREIELAPAGPEAAPSGPEGPITEQWWFWTAIAGGVVLVGVAIGVGVGVADHDAHQPIAGNFTPGIISW